MKYTQLASPEALERTVTALQANNIETHVVETSAEAKTKLLTLLPDGAEIMTMSSTTLEAIGAVAEIESSDRYHSIRKRLAALDPKTQGGEMRKLGAAPQWAVGSVHAITEDGQMMIASASGSQLPAYAYGAENVIWVAGTHKIVEDIDEGFKRIYEHSLPLESERARKAYGVSGSSVNKILIVNREAQTGRVKLILIKGVLGF